MRSDVTKAAYCGLSGIYRLPRFRVVLDDERVVHISTITADQARLVAERVYGRAAVAVELVEETPGEPARGDFPRQPR